MNLAPRAAELLVIRQLTYLRFGKVGVLKLIILEGARRGFDSRRGFVLNYFRNLQCLVDGRVM